MNTENLLASLQSIAAPAGIEEWLITDHGISSGSPSPDYVQAVCDVLTALGVLTTDTGEAASPLAFYFIQSLVLSVRDGALSSAHWQGLPGEGCAGTGAQLLHLIEQNRLTCAEAPTPQRIVRAVTAVIKARHAEQDVYLMQYDDKARQFQPIGGKQELTDANAEAALTRELCEELVIAKLVPGQDFNLRPLLQHVKTDEVSASLHVITRYDHSFYHLTDIRFPLNTDSNTRWLTASELSAGKTRDGLAVTTLFEQYMPGILPTLGYSLP
jgi:hypothetical protein